MGQRRQDQPGAGHADQGRRRQHLGVHVVRDPADTGVVEIRFLAGGFSDNNNNGGLAEVEQFYVVPKAETKPGPVAALASPLNGEKLTAASLNARRYLDVTYTSLDGTAIRKSSIEDAAAEFRLTGTGIADVMLDASGAPSWSGSRS